MVHRAKKEQEKTCAFSVVNYSYLNVQPILYCLWLGKEWWGLDGGWVSGWGVEMIMADLCRGELAVHWAMLSKWSVTELFVFKPLGLRARCFPACEVWFELSSNLRCW